MRVLCISQENQKEIKKMNALEIEKRYITLAKARIEKEVKLGLTARLNNLEKRLTGYEKMLDERINNLKKLLKQRMEEFNGCVDLIVEEKQRATDSLALELAKIDRDIREESVNIIEVVKIDFNALLQRVDANREIVIKKGEVRKIVQEVMQQKERLLVDGENATSESEDSPGSTEAEFSQNEGESDSEDSKETVNIRSYSPMSPDSDSAPAAKRMKK